jgi:hypothetical protein
MTSFAIEPVEEASPRTRSRVQRKVVATLIVVILGGCSAAAVARLRNTAAWAAATGAVLHIDRPVQAVVVSRWGDPATFVFHLTNLTSRPVQIIGFQAPCNCTTSSAVLPLTIAASSSQPFGLIVDTAMLQGRFTEAVSIFTDHADQPRVEASIEVTARQP